MSWTVPGYVAEELIGSGGSGEVWRGRDTASGELVALKRLRTRADAAELERLRREGALLAAFRHPHVIGLRAVLAAADGPVLVLDHAAGGSLAGLLASRGRLTPGEVVATLLPIAGALAAAHAAGLVHGDVSPGNVLLTRDGQPLLADLGTGKLVAERSVPVWGTTGYLDPQVAAGGTPGPASDVYALAAVAAHALAGRPLAAGEAGRAAWVAACGEMAVPEPMVRALLLGLEAPGARPSAAMLGGELAAACRPAPLRLAPAPASASAPSAADAVTHAVAVPATGGPVAAAAVVVADSGARHRRPRAAPRASGWSRTLPGGARVATRFGLGGLLLVLAVGVGAAWGAASRPEQASTVGGQRASPSAAIPSATGPSATSATPRGRGWSDLLAALDARRSAAFARADAMLLELVYVPGSEPLAADLHAVRMLAARHVTARGLRHRLRSVQPVATSSDRAWLRVVDRLDPYTLVTADGRTVERGSGRGDRPVRVELVRTPDGWRIAGLAAG